MSFRYTGGPEDYENVSLCDVLDGTVPAEAFDDCIVLVGVYAAGMLDSYFVPVDRGQQMYGVEIHANAIQAIMEGKTLEVIPAWADGLIAAVIVLLLMIICQKLSVLKTILLCGMVAVVKLVTGLFLFKQGLSWDHLVVPVMAILIAVYYTGLHYYKARKAKQSIEKAFSKYVAPQVIENMLKESSYIENCIVIGENQKFASAIIIPNMERIHFWAAKHNITYTDNEQLVQNPKVLAKIHSEVEEVNSRLAPHENIKREKVILGEWTTANNMLSQTLKLKRANIHKKYQNIIKEIYKN
jgi:hypothetical protein